MDSDLPFESVSPVVVPFMKVFPGRNNRVVAKAKEENDKKEPLFGPRFYAKVLGGLQYLVFALGIIFYTLNLKLLLEIRREEGFDGVNDPLFLPVMTSILSWIVCFVNVLCGLFLVAASVQCKSSLLQGYTRVTAVCCWLSLLSAVLDHTKLKVVTLIISFVIYVLGYLIVKWLGKRFPLRDDTINSRTTLIQPESSSVRFNKKYSENDTV